MYLSTTDYVQHKAAPGTPPANAFYAMMDRYLAKLDALGATIVLTADHGMNDKHDNDGKPNVIYLQDVLDEWYGPRRSASSFPSPTPMWCTTARSARSPLFTCRGHGRAGSGSSASRHCRAWRSVLSRQEAAQVRAAA